MIFLFVATAFLSAILMFSLEPMFARMVLPHLGGSPSVWNTAMVFYQAALLAGYAYAHFVGQGGRWTRGVHFVLMAGTIALLPIGLGPSQAPPPGGSPVLWMLFVMAISIGAPFFLVSTTAPLVQRWLAQAGHAHSRDPYFLYAASNLGSVLGLLLYPFVVEPRWTLIEQSRLWAWGYGVLVVLVAACAVRSLRSAGPPSPASTARHDAVAGVPEPTWPRRLRWMALAMAPSSLMLGVTTHLSTDLVALPLLWVIPLTLYLVTFILAFAKRPLISRTLASRLLVYSILGVLVVFASRTTEPVWFVMSFHLAALFAAGLVCHGALASDRPGTDSLTEYYLWIAAGGAFGGAFNALVAPRIFTSVAEYPLALVMVCMLAPPWPASSRFTRAGAFGNPATSAPTRPVRTPTLVGDVIAVIIFAAIVTGVVLAVQMLGHEWRSGEFILFLAALCLPLFSFRDRPVRFGLGLASLMFMVPLTIESEQPTLHAERSFFGIHRVRTVQRPAGAMHELIHGTTAHGRQWVAPSRQREPLGYYHRRGPAGQIFATLGAAARVRSVGVAGLGTGALSAYSRAGQRWTYFEIDPAVVRIASNPTWFSYLSQAAVSPRIVLGDARLSLAADTTRFDLLVLDAYTSDAIPLHLLTREAFQLYARHLATNGVLVLHLSNRYFDLAPIVGKLANATGLACRMRNDVKVSQRDSDDGQSPAHWAVMSRREADLEPLASDPRWRSPRVSATTPLWTDGFSSVVSALR